MQMLRCPHNPALFSPAPGRQRAVEAVRCARPGGPGAHRGLIEGLEAAVGGVVRWWVISSDCLRTVEDGD